MSISISGENKSLMRRGGRAGQGVRCSTAGCDGEVVRHSLGCGMAVGRCSRCFARHELSSGEPTPPQSGLRRLINEIVNWREDD